MTSFLSNLHAALDGKGALVVGTDPAHLPDPLPGNVTIVLTTSGSTRGTGRPVGLTPDAIRASADATHERLGGPGQWLLSLPNRHIAGVQVCARSILAGYQPEIRGDEPLAQAISRMRPGVRHYASLVPTQLVRALADSGPDLDALASLDGILVGGAATDPATLRAAHAAGLTIYTTYGATETAGGCVYDGVPLTGVKVRIDSGGLIWLGGLTLAWGYLDTLEPNPFIVMDRERWFRTNDLGKLDPELVVLGRGDDVIISGGVNVHPVLVEHAMKQLPGILNCVVVGAPSTEWGSEVVALVVPHTAHPLSGIGPHESAAELLRSVREVVRAELGPAAAPRGLVLTSRLPTRGPGKVDRRGAADLAITALAAGQGARHTSGKNGR